MFFVLTQNEADEATFVVDGQTCVLKPKETMDTTMKCDHDNLVDMESDTDAHVVENMKSDTDSEDNVVDMESDTDVEDMKSDSDSDFEDNDDASITEAFTIHFDKSKVLLSGHYVKGKRAGIWSGVRKRGDNVKRTFDFDKKMAKLENNSPIWGCFGGFQCVGNDITFVGDWKTTKENESILWHKSKSQANVEMDDRSVMYKALCRPDLTVLKMKQLDKTSGTVSFSKDLVGWIKLKNGQMLHGVWVCYKVQNGNKVRIVRNSADYILKTSDGKYCSKLGKECIVLQ